MPDAPAPGEPVRLQMRVAGVQRSRCELLTQALRERIDARAASLSLRVDLQSCGPGDANATPSESSWTGLLLLYALPPTMNRADHAAHLQGAETALRQQWAAAGISFTVLRGPLAQALSTAWQGLETAIRGRSLMGPAAGAGSTPASGGHDRRCERCSDPECEQRLFTTLLLNRTTLSPAP